MPATRPTTIQQRQEILRLAESSMSADDIAQALHLAPRTVRKWRQRAAPGRAGALVSAIGRPTCGPLGTRSALMRYVALRLKRKHLTWGAAYQENERTSRLARPSAAGSDQRLALLAPIP